MVGFGFGIAILAALTGVGITLRRKGDALGVAMVLFLMPLWFLLHIRLMTGSLPPELEQASFKIIVAVIGSVVAAGIIRGLRRK